MTVREDETWLPETLLSASTSRRHVPALSTFSLDKYFVHILTGVGSHEVATGTPRLTSHLSTDELCGREQLS